MPGIMPAVFTFGIPNSFNFTFPTGPNPSCLANGTAHVKLNSNHTGNSTLTKLPLELRIKVYKNVLRCRRKIKRAHKFLGPHPPIIAEDATHIEAIDATLLRTCRTIYNEAVHVLYCTNNFQFRKSRDIEKFAHFGLGNTPFGYYRTASGPASAVCPAPYGRLTMIRHLTLSISKGYMTSDQKEVWSMWCDFFYPPEEQDQLVGFPALEWLALDLGSWDLTTKKIRVKPFLKRLRPTGGLKYLTLIGVQHEQNLRDFKHGFVRQGGNFRTVTLNGNTVANTKVTHDDLPEVSMYVRAIVEKDKCSQAILQRQDVASTRASR